MTEEVQLSDLVVDAAAVEASAMQDPMQWSEALLIGSTGVVLPTVDVSTDWVFVVKLLTHTIAMNVSFEALYNIASHYCIFCFTFLLFSTGIVRSMGRPRTHQMMI